MSYHFIRDKNMDCRRGRNVLRVVYGLDLKPLISRSESFCSWERDNGEP